MRGSQIFRITGLQDDRLAGLQDERITGLQDDRWAGWQVCRFAGWPVCRMRGWQVCRMTDWPVCRMTGWQVCRMTDWQVCRMAGLQDDRLAGLQDDRFAGWQIGRFAGWPVCRMAGLQDDRFAGWPVCRMTGWKLRSPVLCMYALFLCAISIDCTAAVTVAGGISLPTWRICCFAMFIFLHRSAHAIWESMCTPRLLIFVTCFSEVSPIFSVSAKLVVFNNCCWEPKVMTFIFLSFICKWLTLIHSLRLDTSLCNDSLASREPLVVGGYVQSSWVSSAYMIVVLSRVFGRTLVQIVLVSYLAGRGDCLEFGLTLFDCIDCTPFYS